ncbi:hypothetical protein [Halopseudomonas sabulinigri]|uniref:TspB protein n=1 Tax=Halopseudomonas sabulinigri TaxID=472181 RepID=A0ABP9ZTM8_9GAMM
MRWDIRLLRTVLLSVLLIPALAQAAVYQWYLDGRESFGYAPSPLEIAQMYASSRGETVGWVTRQNDSRFQVQIIRTSGNPYYLFADRVGDSCPAGATYDTQTGACEQDCQDSIGATEYQVFQVTTRESVDDPFPDPSTYQVTVPPSVCSGSCRYTNQSTDPVTCGSLNGSDGLGLYCYAPLVGTGEQCQSGDTPHQGPEDFGGPTPVPPTDPDDPTDPANNCGPSHVWSGSTCTPIFESGDDGGNDSGGNTGGGDTGGGSSGGGNGGDSGGDGSGDGSGDGGSSGGGGGGNDGDTTPYDPSAEWSDGEASALGSATGASIGDTLTDSVDGALEERESEIEDALDQVPEQVGDMLGDLPGLSFMDNLFVPAAGCGAITIPLQLNEYDFSIPIDFCVLSKYKPLLEWIIWCLTGIAVWNVYYSGLRLQNASAARGGH